MHHQSTQPPHHGPATQPPITQPRRRSVDVLEVAVETRLEHAQSVGALRGGEVLREIQGRYREMQGDAGRCLGGGEVLCSAVE